ncbi:MAG TPA: hypothetical protein VKI44_13915 [Acetobacteraceae bacterium]|nr:hypothetical protein [Acetobacteraceae bacterium]
MPSLAVSTALKEAFRSMSAEPEMDPGTGNHAVAGIGGSLILLWFLTPALLVLLLTSMFLLRSPRRRKPWWWR